MGITVTFTADSVIELREELIEFLRIGVPAPLPASAAEPAVKRAKSAPEPAPEPKQEPEPADEPVVDYDRVRDVVKALAVKSRQRAIDILTEFGVKTARDLPSDQWASFVARAEEVLNG
jgi:hypothetical protein